MSEFENIGILQEGEEDINFCPHCETEIEDPAYSCCDEREIGILKDLNTALKSELKIYKEELECKRKDNRLFIEHATLVQGDLRKELEALRDCEDCTSQEIEIKELKAIIEDLPNITTSMKAECMGEFKESYEVYNELEDDYIEESRIISWPNMKDIYAMMLKEKLDHIPDTEKPANKGRL